MPSMWVTEELERLTREGLLRSPRVLEGVTGPEAVIDGRRVLLFCSNDYLGLAGHPEIRDAAVQAIGCSGFGACSSRLVAGTNSLHRQLEERLALWLGSERALLFPAGFMANLAVLGTLSGPGDVIFSDELNHSSIIQGCRLSHSDVVIYPHNDLEELSRLLISTQGQRSLIVTDALFSVDGDEADIVGLGRLALEHDSTLVVDEAHSLGVLGPGGRGLCSSAQIAPDVVVGTLGKAFGCSGAFVAASSDVIRLLESRAVSFIYTTAPPPAFAAAALAALSLVEDADEARARLESNSGYLRDSLKSHGCSTPNTSRAHIVPLIVPGISRVVSLSDALFDRGVFVQALRPPTVPPGAERLRWTPTSCHVPAQIDLAVSRLMDALSVS